MHTRISLFIVLSALLAGVAGAAERDLAVWTSWPLPLRDRLVSHLERRLGAQLRLGRGAEPCGEVPCRDARLDEAGAGLLLRVAIEPEGERERIRAQLYDRASQQTSVRVSLCSHCTVQALSEEVNDCSERLLSEHPRLRRRQDAAKVRVLVEIGWPEALRRDLGEQLGGASSIAEPGPDASPCTEDATRPVLCLTMKEGGAVVTLVDPAIEAAARAKGRWPLQQERPCPGCSLGKIAEQALRAAPVLIAQRTEYLQAPSPAAARRRSHVGWRVAQGLTWSLGLAAAGGAGFLLLNDFGVRDYRHPCDRAQDCRYFQALPLGEHKALYQYGLASVGAGLLLTGVVLSIVYRTRITKQEEVSHEQPVASERPVRSAGVGLGGLRIGLVQHAVP